MMGASCVQFIILEVHLHLSDYKSNDVLIFYLLGLTQVFLKRTKADHVECVNSQGCLKNPMHFILRR